MRSCPPASLLRILFAGFALLSCRDGSSPPRSPAPASTNELSKIDSLVAHLPGFLGSEGVTILGLANDTRPVAGDVVVNIVLPDTVSLRNWDRFQEFYRRAWSAMDGKGRFVLADRMRKVRLEFDLADNRLDLEDSTGFFLPPRPPQFSQGSDRIRKTPSEAGMYENEPDEHGTHHGVRCNGLEDVNGRLYYNMTGFSFVVHDQESGVGMTSSSPPHLVDAITGEIWNSILETVWIRGKGLKTRLLYPFPDTTARNWRVVSSNCVEGGDFWQYHPYTRTLEQVSLETLETIAQGRLPGGVRGDVVSIQERNTPDEPGFQRLFLVRDGQHFTILRSNPHTMFAQRWDPPQPKETRYIYLNPGTGPNQLSFDGKDYAIDEIEWEDLEAH